MTDDNYYDNDDVELPDRAKPVRSDGGSDRHVPADDETAVEDNEDDNDDDVRHRERARKACEKVAYYGSKAASTTKKVLFYTALAIGILTMLMWAYTIGRAFAARRGWTRGRQTRLSNYSDSMSQGRNVSVGDLRRKGPQVLESKNDADSAREEVFARMDDDTLEIEASVEEDSESGSNLTPHRSQEELDAARGDD